MLDAREVVQTVRPLRVLYVVDNLETFLLAVEFATLSWGGIFSGLVYAPSAITAYSRSVIDEFDADLLIDLTDTCEEVLRKVAPLRYRRLSEVGQQWPVGVFRLSYGLTTREVLSLFENFSNGDSLSLEVPALYLYEHNQPASPLFGFLFGRVTGAVQDHDPSALQSELNVEPVRVTTNNFMSLGSDRAPSLLQFSSWTCSTTIRGSMLKNVVVVGAPDCLDDLCLAWNVRSTGRRVSFLPTIHSGANALRETVLAALTERPQEHFTPGQVQVLLGSSVHKNQQSVEVQALLARSQHVSNPMTLFKYVSPIWGYSPTLESDLRIEPVSARERRDIAVFSEDSSSPVLAIAPPFVGRVDQHISPQRWIVDVEVIGRPRRGDTVAPPSSLTMDAALLNQFMRGSKRRLSVQSTRSFSLPILKSRQVGEALLMDAGFKASASVPGRYAERIVATLGGYDACRILGVASVKAVLTRVRNGQEVRAVEAIAIAGKTWRQEDSRSLQLPQGTNSREGAQETLTSMIRYRMLRTGLRLRCGGCTREDWYRVGEFGEAFRCRHCFAESEVGRVDRLDWWFRADGLFDVRNEAEGALNTIATLRWFQEVTNLLDPKFVTSTNIEDRETGDKAEIDFLILCERSIEGPPQRIVGESRRFVEYKASEIEKTCAIAQRLGNDAWACFATENKTFSDEEREAFIRLAKSGVRIIPIAAEDMSSADFPSHMRALSLDVGGTLSSLADALMKAHVGRTSSDIRWG